MTPPADAVLAEIGSPESGGLVSLSSQVKLLGSVLGRIIRELRGEEILARVEELRLLCRQAVRENRPELRLQVARLIADLDCREIVQVLQAYTVFFHLVNKVEQMEITRSRRRASALAEQGPARESIEEAVALALQNKIVS